MAETKKPKVLLFYDFPIAGGGSGVYVKYLALRLAQSGKYTVAVAAPDNVKIDPSVIQYKVKLPQIPVFIGRPGLKDSKKYNELTSTEISKLYDAFIVSLIKIMEEFKPDIINAHHIMVHAWAARFIKSIYGTKLILTSHGSCVFAIRDDKRYLSMTKGALIASDVITAVSQDTKTELLKTFGRDLAKKIRVIPGGIRTSRFPANKKNETLQKLRKKYKLKESSYVMFAGRLIEEKGAEYLIKAAPLIQGNILIAGDGHQKDALKKLIKNNNITNVTMIGYVSQEDLLDMYYLASIFVAPSVWDEPMGFTVLEAMAASVPVVASKKVTIAVKDGINGFVVKPRNSKDIAEKVNVLLSNYKLRRTMGKNARETVFKNYTWTEITKKFDIAYKSVLK